ncbi:MAG: bifunctional hydroxymethylpyrimidine kinase/phosphomethylpyrimidine kinase [Candidatus Wenzhouxiangella sp. M2_3B_020]
MSVAEKQQSHRPAALTIAGSDSGGGAGIQADLRAFAAFGVHGASALTALTAQNTLGVHDVRILDAGFVSAQIDACIDDLALGAIKTGMLASADIVEAVATRLGKSNAHDRPTPHLIVDPVMVATSGARLIDDDAVRVLIRRLLPLATLVTPNLPEAAALTGLSTDAEPERLGAALLETGVSAVLVKGGHGRGETCRDVLITAYGSRSLEWTRVPGTFHGTGCAYAASIAALMARGESLDDAVPRAGRWLQRQVGRAFAPLRGDSRILPFEGETASR